MNELHANAMTLMTQNTIDDIQSMESAMASHINCPSVKFSDNIKTKKSCRTKFIDSQSKLDQLELEGHPMLIPLTDTFKRYVIPPLFAQFSADMETFKDQKPEERKLNIISGTNIYLDKLFSEEEIAAPPGTGSKDTISSMDEYLTDIVKQGIKVSKHGFKVAYKDMILHAQAAANWDTELEKCRSMLSTLATLKLWPQFPHTDFPLMTDILSKKLLSIIFAYTDGGAYLTVWEKRSPCNPVIIRIPYGYGILFNRELIHAGGIGPSDDYEKVFKNPAFGFPRGHIYIVDELPNMPFNFVCNADPENDMESYTVKFAMPEHRNYEKAFNGIGQLHVRQKQMPKDRGKFVEPTQCKSK